MSTRVPDGADEEAASRVPPPQVVDDYDDDDDDDEDDDDEMPHRQVHELQSTADTAQALADAVVVADEADDDDDDGDEDDDEEDGGRATPPRDGGSGAEETTGDAVEDGDEFENEFRSLRSEDGILYESEIASGFDTIKSSLRRMAAATSGINRKKLFGDKSATLSRKDTNLTAMLSERVEELTKTLEVKQEQLHQAATLGQDLVLRLEDTEVYVRQLEAKIEREKVKKRKIKSEKSALKKEYQRVSVLYEELGTEHTDLQRQCKELQADVVRLREEITTASTRGASAHELEASQRKIVQLEDHVAQLEDENMNVRKQLDEVTRDLASERARGVNLEVEVDSSRRRLNTMAELEHSAKVMSSQLNSQLDAEELQAENESLRERLLEEKSLHQKTREQHSEAVQLLEHHQQEASELRQRLAEAGARRFSEASPAKPRPQQQPAPAQPAAVPLERTSVAMDEQAAMMRHLSGPLPEAMLVMHYTNLACCLALIIGAIVAALSASTAQGFVIAAVLLTALFWAKLERHDPEAEKMFQAGFGFYYAAPGRAAFLFVLGVYAFALGLPGYIVGSFVVLASMYNYWVLNESPEFPLRMIARARLLAHGSARADLSEPLLGTPQVVIDSSEAPPVRQPQPQQPPRRSSSGAAPPGRRRSSGQYSLPRPSLAADLLLSGHDFESGSDDDDTDADDTGFWTEEYDHSTNRKYYFNAATGETTYTRPAEME